jgi:hypothetical protein
LEYVVRDFCRDHYSGLVGDGDAFAYGQKGGECEPFVERGIAAAVVDCFGFKILAGQDQGGTDMSAGDVLALTPYVIGLNVFSMLLGFAVGIPFALSYRNRITIAIEVGLHNTALALLIAGDKLKIPAMEKPALVYALYSVVVTFPWGIYWSCSAKKC